MDVIHIKLHFLQIEITLSKSCYLSLLIILCTFLKLLLV